MITKKRMQTLCGSLLLGSMAGLSMPVHANNAAMIELLEILRERGSITQDEYRSLKNAAAADKEKTEAIKEEVEKKVAEATKDIPRINVTERLTFASQDGNFEHRIGGRVHFDTYFVGKDGTGLGRSGTNIRRGRLELQSTFWKVWRTRLQYDFGGGDFADAFLQYRGFENFTITAGNHKEPFALEQITSSNNQVFMERSNVNNMFVPGRNPGVSVGGFFADMFSLNAGVYGTGTGFGGSSSAGDSEGWSVTTRGTFSPIHTDDRAVHLGLAYSHRTNTEGANRSFSGREIRPYGGSDLTGTGAIAGTANQNVDLLGGEAAFVYGPLSASAEYVNVWVQRSGLSNLQFNGFYAEANYFLTGETRPYNASSGAFGAIRPNSVVGRGGYGAWQVGIRYSSTDLTDDDVIGGKKDTLTAALNWYPTNNVKLMANYLHTLDIDRPGTVVDGRNPHAFAMRAQVFW